MSAKRAKFRKVRDSWETAITRDPNDDGRFVSLIINRVDKKKFQIGDGVRVTVTLLRRECDQAAEKLTEAVRNLMPHMWEEKMEGESDFERAVIALHAALADYERSALKENELVTAINLIIGDSYSDGSDLLPLIRSYAATERADMREECAKHLELEAKNMLLGAANADLVSPDAQLVINMAKNWQSAAKHIRKLPDTAADEALDNFREAATEAALPLACKAIIESLDGGEFSSESPLAKVAAAIEKVKAAARLEEHRRECVIWRFVTNNPCEKPQDCKRCAELTAAAKEPSHD